MTDWIIRQRVMNLASNNLSLSHFGVVGFNINVWRENFEDWFYSSVDAEDDVSLEPIMWELYKKIMREKGPPEVALLLDIQELEYG